MLNMNKKEISVILPIHQLNSETEKLLKVALKSVENQIVRPNELIIVVPQDSNAVEKLTQYDFEGIKDIVKVLSHDNGSDFQTQVNVGIQSAKSEWVSFLEFDDEYSNIWFKNVFEYINAYPNVGVFMPIVVDTNKEGNFIGLTNEAVWANSFSDELGILDLNALLTYQNFNIDGIVMKKSLVDDFGGFKTSIKLTFGYEFLLRLAFNDVKIMTIPKFGYKHMNQREDSLFSNYKLTMDQVESKWWLGQAKKEYYFTKDRKITYEKTAD
jgi:GT2 family glycosyltransferase